VSESLSAAEIDQLPDGLRRRYWAAEISHGVSGLSKLDRATVREDCRAWIAWIDRLCAGQPARYVGAAVALKGGACEVVAAWHADGVALFSITSPKFEDRFLVGPADLAPL
jgi:hypothetical protein